MKDYREKFINLIVKDLNKQDKEIKWKLLKNVLL
jgi:hypothetical protein